PGQAAHIRQALQGTGANPAGHILDGIRGVHSTVLPCARAAVPVLSASDSLSRISKTPVRRVSSRTSLTASVNPKRTNSFWAALDSFSPSTSEAIPEVSMYFTDAMFTASRSVVFSDASIVLRMLGELAMSMSPLTSMTVALLWLRVAIFISCGGSRRQPVSPL